MVYPHLLLDKKIHAIARVCASGTATLSFMSKSVSVHVRRRAYVVCMFVLVLGNGCVDNMRG